VPPPAGPPAFEAPAPPPFTPPQPSSGVPQMPPPPPPGPAGSVLPQQPPPFAPPAAALPADGLTAMPAGIAAEADVSVAVLDRTDEPNMFVVNDGEPKIVEMQVFKGEPKTKVDVAKLAPFGWAPALLLALIGFVDKIENSIIGGVLPLLQDEFGFDDGIAGVLFAAPSIAAILLLVPAGILADTKNRKNVLVVVILLWSVLSFGTAAAPGLVVFFMFRLLIGTAAPLNVPATSSLIGDYYPLRSRTRAFSITRALENAGLPAGVFIGSVVGEFLGWRAAFVCVGIPGLILAFVIWAKLKEPLRGIGDQISALAGDRVPERKAHASEAGGGAVVDALDAPEPVAEKKQGVEIGAKIDDLLRRLRQIFQIPTVRLLVLGEAVLFASFSGIFSFATTFFAREYFDDPATEDTETAYAGTLVSVGSIPCILLGAYIASKLDEKYTRKDPALRIRIAFFALLIGAAAIGLFILSEPLAVRFFFFFVFAGVNIIAVANLAAAVADVIPARIRGSGFAILQVCLAIGGSFGPIIVGFGSGADGNNVEFGYSLLLIPLLVGAYLVGQARVTYPKDVAAVVLEEAGGPPRVDPLAGRGTNRLAAVSVLCGFGCILLIPLAPVIGLIGIVTGSQALKQIRTYPQYGRGMALVGIWLSSILFLGSIVLLRRIFGDSSE
jgi:MFS family permease